jgi:hypothetical protein
VARLHRCQILASIHQHENTTFVRGRRYFGPDTVLPAVRYAGQRWPLLVCHQQESKQASATQLSEGGRWFDQVSGSGVLAWHGSTRIWRVSPSRRLNPNARPSFYVDGSKFPTLCLSPGFLGGRLWLCQVRAYRTAMVDRDTSS